MSDLDDNEVVARSEVKTKIISKVLISTSVSELLFYFLKHLM